LEAIADMVYGHLQHAERMDRIAISMLSRGTLSLGFLVVVIAATRNLVWGVLALGVGSLAVLVAYDMPNARGVRSGRSMEAVGRDPTSLMPRWTGWRMLGIARLGLPLGVASLLLAVAATAPRYFLERSHGEAALGYFSALAYPSAAFTILLGAFGQAATPRMAAFYASDRGAFWRLVLRISFVPVIAGGCAALGVVLAGPRVLEYVYRREYADYFGVFIVLLAGGAAWSLAAVMGYAATSSRRLSHQAPAAAFICTASLLLSWWLIPKNGLLGAGVATALSGIVAALTYAILFSRKPDRTDQPSEAALQEVRLTKMHWERAGVE
jgi:O-antigen/teichoic acid export membrane protein